MKIFYLANIRFPTEKAHGIQIAKMCESFGLKNKVVLIIPWRFNSIKQDIFDYYRIKKNFKIVRLPSLDLIALQIPKIGYIIQSFTFYISVFIYLLFKKSNVLYTRDWFLGFRRRNSFLELHTLPKYSVNQRIKKFKGIIAVTQTLKNKLIKKGITENKIMVAPDGADIKQFDIQISQEEARKKMSLPLDRKIILYAGHLYKWKGVDVLAEAAKYLNNHLIVFIGGTKKDIKIFTSQFKNYKNILILGHKIYSEIPLYLKAADVLVLPNSAKEKISRYWTSPMKMFEYMASRRPIVASDLPSIREVLNKNNAILVEADNQKELIDGIKKSLENSDFSDKILTRAFQDVQQYGWVNRANNILNFIISCKL